MGKSVSIAILIISVVVFSLFMLGQEMTVRPGASSGNGNPAFLLLLGLVPLFFVLTILWASLLRTFAIRTSSYVWGLLGMLMYLAAAFLYQRSELNEYREMIRHSIPGRNGAVDEAYLESITSSWTIHVSNQYFNFNTFLIFVTASMLAAVIFRLWDHWDKWDEQRNRLSLKKEKRF